MTLRSLSPSVDPVDPTIGAEPQLKSNKKLGFKDKVVIRLADTLTQRAARSLDATREPE
jgi:hypothetical protein